MVMKRSESKNALKRDILHRINKHKMTIVAYLLCPLWGVAAILLAISGWSEYCSSFEEDDFLLEYSYSLTFIVGVIFIIGGCSFIVWYKKNKKYKINIPASFIALREEEYPQLFRLIADTSAEVGIPMPELVYLEEGTTTAVFVSSDDDGMSSSSSIQLSLVLGMALVSQLPDDELRAMLLHEFGHFSQEVLKSTYSVYVFGQLSRIQLQCFPELYNVDFSLRSMRKIVLEAFISTYTAYRLKFLRKIKKQMDTLSEYLEYEADDVAAKHIGPEILQRALFHASEVEHSWRVIEWGLGILREKEDIIIDNPYLVLSLLGKENFTYSSNPPVIQRRIKRLGSWDKGNMEPTSVSTIREQVIDSFIKSLPRKGITISAEDFFPWIKAGYDVYEDQIRKAKSVNLTVKMGRKLHKYSVLMREFEIILDGKYIGLGSVKDVFFIQTKIAPGKHTISAYLPVNYKGIPYSFETEDGRAYSIEFDYRFYKHLGYYEVFVTGLHIV